MTEKLLPHNLDAERGVLAAILLDGKAYFKAKNILSYRDFYHEPHQTIFHGLDNLYANVGDNEEIDPTKLCDFLKQKNKLESVGGMEYILALFESIPTTANVTSHAKIVKQKSVLRRAAYLGQKLHLEAMEETQSADKILDGTCKQILDLLTEAAGYNVAQDILTPSQMANRVYDNVHKAIESPGTLRGIAVGFPQFDFITKGLREFTLLAAETGTGKTTLALNWAVNLGVKKQIPCLFINCEMSADDLLYRIVSNLSGVAEDDLTLGKCQIKQIDEPVQQIFNSQLFITSNLPKNINNIIALIYQHKIQHKIKVVFVDWIGQIKQDELAHKENNQYLTYTRWAQMIKDICIKLDIKPVVVHQLNRGGEIANCKELHNMSSVFCVPETDKNKNYILRIRKNRGGRGPAKIYLEFNKSTLTIRESIPF